MFDRDKIVICINKLYAKDLTKIKDDAGLA